MNANDSNAGLNGELNADQLDAVAGGFGIFLAVLAMGFVTGLSVGASPSQARAAASALLAPVSLVKDYVK